MEFLCKKRTVIRIVLMTCMLLLLSSLAFAQTETGQIVGTVKDPTGAVIPGAGVRVRNIATSAERATTSGNSGEFAITNLLPATYEVTVDAKGFNTYKQQVVVTVGSKSTVDITLKVGAATTTVEVVGEGAVQVNTESQVLSDTVTTTQILELPTLTRNPYDLVAIMGNVSPGDPSGRGVGYAINGQRAASTNILLDGSDNTDDFTASVGQSVPLDSVQEFSVVSGTFSAEYGRASGGVVNVATKSGTNDFHGTAYEFNRLSKLTSNGFQNNAYEIPKGVYTRNQFGYSIGGPIKKDKLFFFSSTEWTRIRSASTRVALVPTPQLLAASAPSTQAFFNAYGSLQTPINGPIFTKAQIPGLCNAAGPCANLPANTPMFGQVNYAVPTDAGGGYPSNGYQTVARMDYNLSDRTTIYGRYALQSTDYFVGTNANSPYKGYNTGEKIFNNNILLSVTHTFSPHLVTQSKAVFNRLNDLQPLGDAPVGPTLYFYANSAARINGIRVAFPGYLPFNPGSAIPFGGPQNLGQLYQDASYVHGNHQFRFGGQYIYLRDNRAFGAYEEAVEGLGTSLKQGMDNFLNGLLRTFSAAIYPQGKYPGQTVTLPVGPPDFTRSNRYNDFALYAQDNWRIHPRVMLNLGLRWEYFGVQHNKDPNKDSNFYLGSGSSFAQQYRNGQVMIAPNSPVGGLWGKNFGNFGPRVGFAWDIFGDGKTSLRGGYGISYERNFGNVTYNVIQNPPNYAVISLVAGVNLPTIPITTSNYGPMAGSTGSVVLPPAGLRHVMQNIQTAYAHFWSVSLEREIMKNTLLSLQYTGSKGVNLYSIDAYNRPGAGAVYLGDPPGLSLLNTQYAYSVYTRGNNAFSNYNAFVATLKSRNLFNQGLQLEANYTWAHSIDNLSSTFSESGNNFNLGSLDPFNPQLDRGNADFDIRHRLAISGIWSFPWAKSTSGIAKQILDGWSVSPIFTAQTGTPFTIWDCTNGYLTCMRMLQVSSPVATTGPGSPLPITGLADQFYYIDLTGQLSGVGTYANPKTGTSDFGPYPANMTSRNMFRGPGTWNLDLGIYKDFKFKNERYGLQFRGEMYNVFNHANLYANTGSAEIDAYNYVSAYRYGRRYVQFALKFLF